MQTCKLLWGQAIQSFAWNENDRLGKYFTTHLNDYTQKFDAASVAKMQERLTNTALYELIRKKDSAGFYNRLAPWLKSADAGLQKKAVMMEAEYYLTTSDVKNFVKVTDRGLQGVMQNDDMGLSFLARRCQYLGQKPRAAQQAYKLAKRAAVINPENTASWGTLAKVASQRSSKEEALVAAEKQHRLSVARNLRRSRKLRKRNWTKLKR